MNNNDCLRFESILDRTLSVDRDPSPRDVSFLDSHGKSCPHCSLQKNVIDTLLAAQMFDLTADMGNADIEFKARQLVRGGTKKDTIRFKSLGFAVACAASVALLIGLFLLLDKGDAPRQTPAEKAVVRSGGLILPRLKLIRGNAKITDPGDSVALGKTVRTGDGSAALEFDNGTKVVIDSESSVTLEESKTELTRFRLGDGHAAFLVAKLPGGSRFEVDTPAGKVRVIGTAFSVSCDGGRCEIKVAKGTVTFSSASGLDVVIQQGQLFDSETGLGELSRKERLGVMDQLLEEPQGEVVDEETRDEAIEESQSQKPPSRAVKRSKKNKFHSLGNQLNAGSSVDELLEKIRMLRARKDWSGVVRTYRQLIEHHPKTPEARTCLVPMGKIQLERLGEANRSLKTFQTYIRAQKRGSLAEEAGWGIIMSLRRLGRTAEEKTAIQVFLREHPRSLYAPWVRERYEKLHEESDRI